MKGTISRFRLIVLFCASGHLAAFAQLGTINHDTLDLYGVHLTFDTAGHVLYGAKGQQAWNGMAGPGVWQWHNGQFSLMGGVLSANGFRGLEIHAGQLYASGTFSGWVNGYDIEHLGRWDGTEWEACGEPNAMTYLHKVGNELWCSGTFDSIGGQPIDKPARWNGSVWEGFATPFYGDIRAGAYYQDDYYFGGNTSSSWIPEDIVRWDGQDWVSVGGGIPDYVYGQVNTMVVYQDKLFVGGIFGSFGFPGYHSMSWDGVAWTPFFPELVGCVGGQVKKMEVIDGKLYQTGRFRFAGDDRTFSVLIYDGTSICGLGSAPLGNIPAQAYALTGSADSIFFTTDAEVLSGDTVNYYAVWQTANGPDTCVTIPTSMREQVGSTQLRAYPNPTDRELTVELPTVRGGPIDVRIVDALGREVQRQIISTSNAKKLLIDVSQLALSSYVGRLTGGATGHFWFIKRE